MIGEGGEERANFCVGISWNPVGDCKDSDPLQTALHLDGGILACNSKLFGLRRS